MAALYPIFLNLENRPVLIVGGGSVALRKATGLVPTGARITVVSPAFVSELESLPIARVAQAYESSHMTLSRWALVFAATSDAKVNEAVINDAASNRVFCCRVDAPDESDFVNGAMGHVGGIAVAVSTGKASPVIAARIRDAAVAAVDPVLGEWTALLERWREEVLKGVPNTLMRRDLLKRIAGAEMECVLRQQGASGAQRVFENWMREAAGA